MMNLYCTIPATTTTTSVCIVLFWHSSVLNVMSACRCYCCLSASLLLVIFLIKPYTNTFLYSLLLLVKYLFRYFIWFCVSCHGEVVCDCCKDVSRCRYTFQLSYFMFFVFIFRCIQIFRFRVVCAFFFCCAFVVVVCSDFRLVSLCSGIPSEFGFAAVFLCFSPLYWPVRKHDAYNPISNWILCFFSTSMLYSVLTRTKKIIYKVLKAKKNFKAFMFSNFMFAWILMFTQWVWQANAHPFGWCVYALKSNVNVQVNIFGMWMTSEACSANSTKDNRCQASSICMFSIDSNNAPKRYSSIKCNTILECRLYTYVCAVHTLNQIIKKTIFLSLILKRGDEIGLWFFSHSSTSRFSFSFAKKPVLLLFNHRSKTTTTLQQMWWKILKWIEIDGKTLIIIRRRKKR